jgi:hypothetical protein
MPLCTGQCFPEGGAHVFFIVSGLNDDDTLPVRMVARPDNLPLGNGTELVHAAQEATCPLEGPSMLRTEGSLDLLEAAGGIRSPDSLLASSLSSQNASFGSGGSLPLGPMHDLFLDGGHILPPGVFTHTGSML